MLNLLRASTFALLLPNLTPAFAQPAPDWNSLAASQSDANRQVGPRQVPARTLPVPTANVSPQEQALIAGAYVPYWNANPANAAEWKDLVAKSAAGVNALLPGWREKLGVTTEPTTIGGVPCFIVQPKVIPVANRERVLLHLHGGGYVFSPGESGTREAIMMAAYAGYRIVSVDYRMPPDAPYPAAMDDAMAVYREVIKTTDPKRVGIFGTSTGGGMVLALALRIKDEHLPLPAAMAPGTPWADLAEIGDTYFTHEFADNVLVSWKGWLGRAALLYANGRDLKDPQLSPIYGDFHGLPPAILTSGTRDLFLSNTVRVHRKLRQAGVEAMLQVFEGQSHAQYYNDPYSPETIDYHTEVARFFDTHLAP